MRPLAAVEKRSSTLRKEVRKQAFEACCEDCDGFAGPVRVVCMSLCYLGRALAKIRLLKLEQVPAEKKVQSSKF